jgi:MFS family permease
VPRNVRLFLVFRLLFNARFYYPVLAVFFVDLGLTLEQYALLNVAWAASIVTFELPLGAFADRYGRRPLVVGAAALMVVEMAVLAFAPTDDPSLLFWVFLLNRILSGLAEAAASGADEALAYDTLVEAGRRKEWPDVLAKLQRLMAGGFIGAMVLGGALYDPEVVNGVLGTSFLQQETARFPVYATLALACGALLAAASMREPAPGGGSNDADLKGVLKAWTWIRSTRFVFALILFWLVIDSAVRLLLTLTSSYYRMIDIPAWSFGWIGAGFSALGFATPWLAKPMLERNTPLRNFAWIGVLVLGGLLGTALSRAWYGALFGVLFGVGMHLLGFLGSQYLNDATESARRATVLSFRSLAGNLAYGLAGILYAVAYRAAAAGKAPEPGSPEENGVLATTLWAMPAAFAVTIVPLLFWARRIARMNEISVPDA